MTVFCSVGHGSTVRSPTALTPRGRQLVHKQVGRCSSKCVRTSVVEQGCWVDGSDIHRCRPGSWQNSGVCVTAETVSKLCEHGHLAQAVEALEILVDTSRWVSKSLFYTLVRTCVGKKDLVLGSRVHALAVRKGYESDTFLSNHIMRMYASHGRLQDAMQVLEGVARPDAFTWSAIISAHVRHGRDRQAIELYQRMRRSGVKPDGHVFAAALQACARGEDLKAGQQVHSDVLASGIEPDVFVCSGLVDMYAKCGSLEDAQRVFEGLAVKNVVTWTAMIAGYAQKGMGRRALRLYNAMKADGMAVPDSVTFVCLLQACACGGTPALNVGKQLHIQIREGGLEGDVFVVNSLVSMYARCGRLEDARRLFDGARQRNLASWNAMIAAYSQQGMGQEALRLYSVMVEDGMTTPNSITFVCLLQACANVAALHLGRQLHGQIVQQGLEAEVLVAGSLINMYGKCGSMVEAQQVFDQMREKNVVAWSALIAGYTCQGESEVIFDLVQSMREDGIDPDGVTFLSVLTVCSHVGQVTKGWEYFEAMHSQHGITPTVDHYTCMVDLLGRAGQVGEAMALVRSMPVSPNAAVWHALLGACRIWGNVEVGLHAFHAAVKLDEEDATAYAMMWNIYIGAEMWEHAHAMQVRRKGLRSMKLPGQSWWTDKEGLVHSFLVGDEKLPGSSPAVYAQLVAQHMVIGP